MTPREAVAAAVLHACPPINNYTGPEYVADAALAALSAVGFEIVPTALVDALREAARYGVLNVARRDKIIAEFDAYRAPVLLGQTEETP